MDALTLWMLVGFLFAVYEFISKDSVETLVTFISSNIEAGKAADSVLHRKFFLT